MSPRWSPASRSAWDGATAGRSTGYLPLIGVAVIIFVLGSIVGFTFGNSRSGSNAKTAASEVIDPIDRSLASVANSDKSSKGAVRAASSLVTGLPNLALLTSQEQSQVLDRLVAPDATANLKPALQAAFMNASQQLRNPTVGVTGQVIITPATYKVTMNGDSKATVDIWFVTVFLDKTGPRFESLWATDTINLTFTDQWRVSNFSTKEGPTPPLYATAGKYSTFEDAAASLNGEFFRYRYAPSR